LPAKSAAIESRGNVTLYNHAPAGLLNELICNAEMVISRAGYTTVMDLLKLRKKSILVPGTLLFIKSIGRCEGIFLSVTPFGNGGLQGDCS
jgi:hypothetical protein